MPPPYGGIPKVSLLYARTWKKMGHEVAVTFVYRPENADDHGANAQYFFEYDSKPTKLKKAWFLIRYFFTNPALYFKLYKKYYAIFPKLSKETILYSAYGVYMDGVIAEFKPDIILCQAALIKAFMVSELAHIRKIPVVYNTYAEVHDLRMGVNKNLDEAGRTKYWNYFMNLPQLIIGMDNCSRGPLTYLPPEKVKVFYDTCDFTTYQMKMDETKEQLRDSLGLPHDQFLVGMVGAFHARKGHDHLIKAIGILKKQGHNIGAVICGGTRNAEEDLKKWRAVAAEEGVEDRVYFFSNFGELQLARLHRGNDAYANLSNSPRSCGLDLALLEAMSSALPIVVYDNGALPTAVPEGKNGYVVPTSDVPAVADAILKLFRKTPEERKDMGNASKAIASKCDLNLTSEIKIGWFKEVIAAYKK